MSDKSEQVIRENTAMQGDVINSDKPVVEDHAQPHAIEETQKLHSAKAMKFLPEVETTPLPAPSVGYTKKAPDQKRRPVKFKRQASASVRMLQDHCRQLCLSLFFREDYPVRSLGFTSSIEGEGKSFLALITARVLAHDSTNPVVLIDCNWEHPGLNESFDIPTTPGLAEWLRGDCDEEDIRYQVGHNLTVIPAGNGSQDAVKLLKQAQVHGLLKLFRRTDELFIVDLPPILTTGYGTLAAGLLESIIVVARAQAVPDSMVADTCKQLKDMPIHGIILNQGASRIPYWIRQLL